MLSSITSKPNLASQSQETSSLFQGICLATRHVFRRCFWSAKDETRPKARDFSGIRVTSTSTCTNKVVRRRGKGKGESLRTCVHLKKYSLRITVYNAESEDIQDHNI